jgi:hypothetical protein
VWCRHFDTFTHSFRHGDLNPPTIELLHLLCDGTTAFWAEQRLRQGEVELDDEVIVNAFETRMLLLLNNESDGPEQLVRLGRL